jgi:hypothetical protein
MPPLRDAWVENWPESDGAVRRRVVFWVGEPKREVVAERDRVGERVRLEWTVPAA